MEPQAAGIARTRSRDSPDHMLIVGPRTVAVKRCCAPLASVTLPGMNADDDVRQDRNAGRGVLRVPAWLVAVMVTGFGGGNAGRREIIDAAAA